MMSDNDKILKFEIPVKKSGWLTRRSENLHMWRKRFYLLENNILKIGEDEAFKDLKIVELADYDIKWLDKFEKRYALLFTANHKNVKYKYIYLGDETEAAGKELFEKIQQSLAEMKKLKDPNYKPKEIAISPTKLPNQPFNANEAFFTDKGVGFSIPEDVPEWVEQVCSTYELDKEDPLATAKESTESWKLIEDRGNFKIFNQSIQETQSFKVFATFSKIKPVDLFQLLVDLERRHTWDHTVELNQTLSNLSSGHLGIIHRVQKPFGQITFARESFLSRVIFNSIGKFFVLEKSLDDIEELQKSSSVLSRTNINHSALKIGASPDGGSNLSILYSQQADADLTPEIDVRVIIDSFKQIEKLAELEIEKILTLNVREEFEVFLGHWKPKGNQEEESKYEDGEKFMDEDEILKETRKPDGLKGSNKELIEIINKINSGKIVQECVDPNFPYPDFSKYKDHKIVEKIGNWLLGTDFKRDPSNGLEVLNNEWIDSQKRVLSHILRNMGKNLLEGKSIMNMSLPVSIFSKDTIMQRAAKTLAYAPIFVEKAADTSDPLEQFKVIVTFYFSLLHLGIEQQKPFNPILGETYQGLLAGVPVVVEQVSHHPPISYLHYKTEKYTIHGTYLLEANAGANSVTGLQKGRITIQLPGVNEYSMNFPQANVCNMLVGKRSFNWSKKMKVFDKKNGFYSEIHLYPDEKGLIGGLFSRKKEIDCTAARGKIWRVKKEYTSHLWDQHAKKQIKFNEKEHSVETIGAVNGSWMEFLDFDNKRYWQLNDYRPYELVDQKVKVLPSDSSCRQDLLAKQSGDDALSQEWKEKLEIIQRADRKLREKVAKKK